MQRITPFLWFDGKAEEAADFYTSIFKRSKITEVSRLDSEKPGKKGKAMSVAFEIEGIEYIAFNGGPGFKFTSAISLFVSCKDQKEVDYYWERLSKGGKKGRCGWLTDKFGLSWQVVPNGLPDLLGSDDEQKSGRAMQAMLKMSKLDIGKLRKAFEGK